MGAAAVVFLSLLAGNDELRFETDAAKGLAEAKKSGRPALLYFWADWSPHCRAIEKGAFRDSRVVKAAKRFVPIRIDATRDKLGWVDRYRVRHVPTLILVKPDGKPLWRYREDADPTRLWDGLREAARRHAGAFWMESEADAMAWGSRSRRLVVVCHPPKARPAGDPERELRASLGPAVWSFLFLRGEPVEKGRIRVLDPLAQGFRPRELLSFEEEIPVVKLAEYLKILLEKWKIR